MSPRPAFLVSLLLLLLLLPLLLPGTDDPRMVSAISTDEAACGTVLLEMENGEIVYPFSFYNYGSLLFFAGYPAARFIHFIGYTGAWRVAGLRLISILSLSLTAGLLFHLSRRKGPIPAILALLLLLDIPLLLHWSVRAHPDLLQLLFLTAAWAALPRRGAPPRSWAACGLFLGLAAGTKYAGFIILPVPLLLAAAEGGGPRRILHRAAALLSAFAIVFILTQPQWIFRTSDALASLTGEARGFGVAADEKASIPANIGIWSLFLVSTDGIGLAVTLLGTAGLLLDWVKDRSREAAAGLLWSAIYLAFVVVMVRDDQATRHLFPILPPLIIGTASAGRAFLDSKRPLLILGAVFLLLAESPRIVLSSSEVSEALYRSGDPRIIEGRDLLADYPVETRILAHWWVYLPPRFTNYRRFYLHPRPEDLDPPPEMILLSRDEVLDPYRAEVAADTAYLLIHSGDQLDAFLRRDVLRSGG